MMLRNTCTVDCGFGTVAGVDENGHVNVSVPLYDMFGGWTESNQL